MVCAIFASLAVAAVAHADLALPPWSEPGDLPVATWARSVAPSKDEVAVFSMPNRVEPRRGTLHDSSRPPLYGAMRGAGCGGRWLLIGPFAWVCSDEAEPSGDDPPALPTSFGKLPRPMTDDGLGLRYFFVGPDGASGFRDLAHAEEDAPEADFDAGFSVAIVQQQTAHGRDWGRTRHGLWIDLHELNAAHPIPLHGSVLSSQDPGQPPDVAWVMVDHATTYADAAATKRAGLRLRFDVVHWRELSANGKTVRVTADGVEPAEWMRASELAHPTTAPPPPEAGADAAPERWIDVDLATQTLLAYEGTMPVYAALVSAGRGAQGTETATPKGVYRIWVKLTATNMDNLENEDIDKHYSIEDVPYVQFFSKGVALHGAFWHRSFGTPHSHGCVNLAPVDARWLFDFTAPHLPVGWSAVLPVKADPGTVVRVR